MKANKQFSQKIFYWLLALCLFAGMTFSAAASPYAPQPGPNYTVNDPGDAGGVCDDANCTLRAAITAANSDGLAGEHTIGFDLTTPVTITLSGQLPEITTMLVISGPGADLLTISGDGQYRVLEVGTGAMLDLSGVTISAGNTISDGAGVLNYGTLFLTDCLFDHNISSNEGGGVRNDGGVVVIRRTTFNENLGFHFGGLSNTGSVTIDESVFSGNHGRTGAGIENSGVMTITNTTFSDNIAQPIYGGAIVNSGELVLANTTFYQNGSTHGADVLNGGRVHITNSTFYGAISPSYESIYNEGSGGVITMTNTILAASETVSNCVNVDGAVMHIDASNLSTDASCSGATQATLAELALGPLQDNGGQTPTIALLDGSVALEAGNDAVCAAAVGAPAYGAGGRDQRGVQRSLCDAGAYELERMMQLYLPLVLQAFSVP